MHNRTQLRIVYHLQRLIIIAYRYPLNSTLYTYPTIPNSHPYNSGLTVVRIMSVFFFKYEIRARGKSDSLATGVFDFSQFVERFSSKRISLLRMSCHDLMCYTDSTRV